MPWLPARCKVGCIVIELLLKIRCRWCGALFYICRRCFRGQVFCSDGCRLNGRRQKRREAQRRYSRSDKGKETRKLNKQKQRLKKNEKTGADTSSTPESPYGMVRPEQDNLIPRCCKCGRIGKVVDKFPRRLYGDYRRRALYGQVFCFQ